MSEIKKCISCAKDAPLCHLVDTPGLVDGEMKYPFDVNNAIFEMSNLADLVLVFFDPIGQALTKRTLDVVETVHKKYPEKIRFFLSKVQKIEKGIYGELILGG